MNRLFFLICFFTFVSIFSCKKDKEATEPAKPTDTTDQKPWDYHLRLKAKEVSKFKHWEVTYESVKHGVRYPPYTENDTFTLEVINDTTIVGNHMDTIFHNMTDTMRKRIYFERHNTKGGTSNPHSSFVSYYYEKDSVTYSYDVHISAGGRYSYDYRFIR